MLKLLVLIALQHSSSCCIFNEFAGPVLSHLRIPNEHILHKRQVQINKEHLLAGGYDDLNNNYSEVKPQLQELYSTPQQSKYLNEVADEIDSDSLPLLPVDFMPEAQTDYDETDVDILFDSPIINDIGLIDILNDLSDCVELNRIQTLRLCPNKNKNHKTKHLRRFEKLTDKEIESEIEKKCKTVNAILEKSAKEIKDSFKRYMAIDNGKDSNENTPDESLIRLSNDIISTKPTIGHFISFLPHHNLQDDDYNKQAVGDMEDPYIKDMANIETNEHPEEAKQAFLRDKAAEQTKESYLDPANQNVLDSRSPKYYTKTINVHKIELENSLNDLFNPTKEMLGKVEYDAPVSKNHTPEADVYYGMGVDKSPSLRNLQTNAEPVKDNPERNFSENLQDINSRRSYFRPYINDNEVPMIKIITHEYPDGNVVSKVNGTEILINNGTPTIKNYTNVFVKNMDVQDNNNVSEILYKFSNPKQILENGEFYSESHTQVYPKISFIGRLYLIHKKEKIPAQFIQESDGNISVGLDILSICETENHDSNSVLFKLLCKCKNCSSGIN